jgi:hypothetical protein
MSNTVRYGILNREYGMKMATTLPPQAPAASAAASFAA